MLRARWVVGVAVVGAVLGVPALAQDGRWTLRLQAGGLRTGGESLSTAAGLAPAECMPVEQGRCWDLNRYRLQDDRPLAGLALAYRVAPQWSFEATLWHSSLRLRAARAGWPCSGVDCAEHFQGARDDVGLSGADLGVTLHLPARNQVGVFGGVLAGWTWAEKAHLYGSGQGFPDHPREVRGGLELGALAGAEVALGGGAWRAGMQVRHTWASLRVEETDILHSRWAHLAARLTAVQLTLGYTF
ncbi:MAG TPA: hypothetical protein PLS53_11585 [Thermoanaerobaculaceae bacterium]|nr:hypothetical protein [Thermoanaerobaculaceae bacterium]HPS78788.1 hypothetical protein [Thermoanaerobaculaceae bacterium]